MNIQQLRYFCSVMQTGTFSGAAREEGVSVQAVSKALAALEEADILGGLPVDGGVLWCATETVEKAKLDQTVAIAKEVCGQ